MKVKKKDLYIMVLGIIVLHLAFINISVSHFASYMNVRAVIAVLGALMLLRYGRVFFSLSYRNLNLILLLWAVSALLSPIVYKRGHINFQYIQSIVFVLSVVETFLYFEIVHYFGRARLGLKVICTGFIFYCVLTDVLMFIRPAAFHALAARDGNAYLIGNKFLVSYAHIFLVAFWNILNHNMKKFKKYMWNMVLIVVTLYISAYTECTTAFCGMIVYVIMMIIGKRSGRQLKKTMFVFGVLGISDSLLILNTEIMSIPAVYNLITNVLHEELTFNIRLQAYAKVISMIRTSFWFGFGIENNYPVSMNFLNIANAQNGLFDHMVSFGFIGTVLMLCIFYTSMKRAQGVKNFSIWALIYTLIVMSTIETTLNLRFYVTVAVLAVAKVFEEEELKIIHQQNL